MWCDCISLLANYFLVGSLWNHFHLHPHQCFLINMYIIHAKCWSFYGNPSTYPTLMTDFSFRNWHSSTHPTLMTDTASEIDISSFVHPMFFYRTGQADTCHRQCREALGCTQWLRQPQIKRRRNLHQHQSLRSVNNWGLNCLASQNTSISLSYRLSSSWGKTVPWQSLHIHATAAVARHGVVMSWQKNTNGFL